MANTISGSISGYSISAASGVTPGGTLTLLTAAQPSTTGPMDLAVAPGDGFLYVLDSNAGASPGTVAGFSIGANGALTSITTGISGVPPGSLGIAMR